MERLLFFDIDGTLAVPGQDPSPETVAAIRAARANGHKTILCTGRTEVDVPPAVWDIGFDAAVYSAGGRVVIGGETIEDRTMPRDMAQAIISVLDREGVSFTLECADGNYMGGPDMLPLMLSVLSDSSSEMQRILLTSTKRLTAASFDGPIYKISFCASSMEQIDRIAAAFDDTVKVVSFESMDMGIPLIAAEASDKGINKGLALQCICAYYGSSPEQCVAFGDSMNDAEMLQAAGIGIAMGDSVEQVKALADQICESCADNGIAKALDRLGLTAVQ